MLDKFRLWLVPIVALIAIVFIIWIPFGFKVTGLMEEWMVLHSMESGAPSERNEDYSLFITSGLQRMRPLAGAAFVVGYSLAPDSFFGFNVLMMGLIAAKGVALYLILRKLTAGNTVYALLVALLFVVYPADGGLFTLRSISIHLSIFWLLLGIYLFLVYFETGRWWALVASWLALIGSIWIYEVAYPLIFLTPVLLVMLEGRLNRRVIRASLLLYVAPLAGLLYYAYTFTQGASYQSWLLQRSGLNQQSVIGEMLTSIGNAYNRHFAEGWLQAFQQITPAFVFLSLVMVVAAFIFGWLLLRRQPAAPGPKRRYWQLALLGFAVVGIGYAPFLITPWRNLDWRVYSFSSVGGAIFVGSMAYLLVLYTRLRPAVFIAIMSVLIGIGTLRALNQHAYYAGLSADQQRLLRGVAAEVPAWKANAPLIVVDETGRYYDNWTMGASYLLKYALRYLYEDYSLNAVLCSFDRSTGQMVALRELQELCVFTPEGITVREADAEVGNYPYDEIVMVRFSERGAELLHEIPASYVQTLPERMYNPDQFVDQSAPPPRRFNTLFSITG